MPSPHDASLAKALSENPDWAAAIRSEAVSDVAASAHTLLFSLVFANGAGLLGGIAIFAKMIESHVRLREAVSTFAWPAGLFAAGLVLGWFGLMGVMLSTGFTVRALEQTLYGQSTLAGLGRTTLRPSTPEFVIPGLLLTISGLAFLGGLGSTGWAAWSLAG